MFFHGKHKAMWSVQRKYILILQSLDEKDYSNCAFIYTFDSLYLGLFCFVRQTNHEINSDSNVISQ